MDEKVCQVNLKEHLEKYVWKRMRKTEGFFKTMFMRKSQYYIDINWGYLKFEHETEKTRQEVVDNKEDKVVKDRKDAELNTCEAENKTADEQIHRLSASRETKATQTPTMVDDNEPNDIELYSCEYENKTDDEQIHRFSTSRETTATTRIELQENYTLGAETNIEVNIGCVKLGGKVNGGLSVTKADGQEYSKSLTWSINTEIKVPKKQRAIAKLHVDEYRVVTDFTVKTTVTLPKKKMPVSIRRISDNKLIYTVWIQNIDAIFDHKFLKRAEDVIEVIDIPNEAENKTYIGLILKSRGTCNNVSFRNQNVTVECKPFSDENQLQKEETKCAISSEDRDKYVTPDSYVNDHTADAEHYTTIPKSVDGVLPGVADDSSATVPNGRLHQYDGIPKLVNGVLSHATEKTSEIVRQGNVLPGVADDSSATVPNGRLHQYDGIPKLVNGVLSHATEKTSEIVRQGNVLPGVADDSSATVPNGRLHQYDGIPKFVNGVLSHATEKTSEIVRNGNVLPGVADDSSATVPIGRLHQDDGIPKLVKGVLPHATETTSETIRNGKLSHVADVHVETVETENN